MTKPISPFSIRRLRLMLNKVSTVIMTLVNKVFKERLQGKEAITNLRNNNSSILILPTLNFKSQLLAVISSYKIKTKSLITRTKAKSISNKKCLSRILDRVSNSSSNNNNNSNNNNSSNNSTIVIK
jgi:hypothetical protein